MHAGRDTEDTQFGKGLAAYLLWVFAIPKVDVLEDEQAAGAADAKESGSLLGVHDSPRSDAS